MIYKVTFLVTIEEPYSTVSKKIVRRFPQHLCGVTMNWNRQMFTELMLADYPYTSIKVLDLTIEE
jgi:hypothetical protein